jgi:sugar phosphate isomerase/epimerase
MLMTHALTKSYRGFFPFKLGTTSYIYPDSILPNVSRLGPFLDEIELVIFESHGQDNYPTEAELEGLVDLSRSQGVGYNIHLPIDIYLGDRSEETRRKGVSIVTKVIERTLCLKPSFYTLHLDRRNETGGEEADMERWRTRIIRSMEEILKTGIEPSRVSVETLGYPFEWTEDVVNKFDCSICLDIGHILLCKQDLGLYWRNYRSRTSIIHLHGFRDGIDHISIGNLERAHLDSILSCLRDFEGVLSIEVFSLEDLKESLEILEREWPS